MAVFKYPKFTVLALSFLAAWLIFNERYFAPLHDLLVSLDYAGTFIAGFFYAEGLTGAPAMAVLLILSAGQNIIFAGLVAGAGSLLADIVIFKFIRHSFRDEIDRLSREKFIAGIGRRIPGRIRRHVITVLALFFIASPLPDEIGVSMIACEKWMSARTFSILCYALNTAGIFVILLIGTVL